MKDTAAADKATDEMMNIDDANLAPMNNGNGSGHQSNKQIKNIPEATTATETETAVSSAASSVCQMLSSVVGTLAVQNYIQQLHQKDERIRELEEENRKLRLLFITQAEQLQQRNEQLLKDLSQHAELVMKLETDLANSRLNGIPTNSRDEIPMKKARRNGNVPSSTSASAVSKAPVPVPSSSFIPQQQQQSTTTSTDELYARLLQTVVEQQQNNQPIGNPIGDQDQGLLEIDEYAAAEQLVKIKMMAEEPSLAEESVPNEFLQNMLLALVQMQPSDELDAPEKKPSISDQQKTEANQTQLSQQQQPPQMQIEQQMEVDEIDIDTAQLTRRVKECLSKNEISQRAFGAHILKISASSVSDALNKPKTKPWALLGRKQRQPYLKMLEFLNDSGAVERLRADEQHRCEMNSAQNDASSTKRKTTSSSSHSNILSTMVSMTAPPTAVPVLDATTKELRMGGAAPKKIPRLQQHRTLITAKQTEALHFVLAHEPRPNPQCIEQLATKLGLPFHTLTIWFRNHRRKTRQNTKKIKQEADDSDADETAKLFREELTELLRRHSDADAGNANLDMDIIASGNGRGSVETASAESSLPPSPPQMNGCYGYGEDDADANSLISVADGLYIDEDADEDNSESTIPGVKQIGSSDSRGNSCRVTSKTKSAAKTTSSSASTSSTSPPLGGGGGSQLDKVIARMHSRLAKTGRVSEY